MEAEILTQLVWIKWLLIVVALAAIAVAGVFVWIGMSMVHLPKEMQSKISFHDQAKALLDGGKPEEVLALAEERATKFPADAYVHWFAAQASYRLGNFPRALVALKKTQELQPDWEETYTRPLIRVIEARLSENLPKPDLRVVTPNPTASPDAPPGRVS